MTDLGLTLRLLRFLSPLGGLMALSALLRVISHGSGMALAALCAGGLGTAVGGHPAPGGRWFVPLLAVCAVLKALARYGEQLSGHGVAFSLLARMRGEAFRKLETLAPAFPERESSGEYVSRLVADIDRIEVFYAHTVGPVIAVVVLGSGAVAAIAFLLGAAGAILLATALALIAFVLPWCGYASSRVHGAGVRQTRAALQGSVGESLRGAEDLYCLHAEEARRADLTAMGRRLVADERRVALRSGLKDGFVDLTASLLLCLMASLAFRLRIPSPAAFAALALAAASLAPALAVGRAFDDLPETAASALRYFEILDRDPCVTFSSRAADTTPGLMAPEGGASVVLDRISFSYDGLAPVLRDVSLRVDAGAHLCLIGPSGGGKSTLLRLVARCYDAAEGSVLLGGAEVRGLSERELRSRLTLLSQDVFLFDGTVREDLTVFFPGANDAELSAALAAVGFPGDGSAMLDRRVGARGRALSGGERKRLAAARIVLGGASVVLLDESFSSLDSLSRGRVRRAVLDALAGRTIIESTHEREGLAGADMVAVMEHGRLAAFGPPAGLAGTCGFYDRFREAAGPGEVDRRFDGGISRRTAPPARAGRRS